LISNLINRFPALPILFGFFVVFFVVPGVVVGAQKGSVLGMLLIGMWDILTYVVLFGPLCLFWHLRDVEYIKLKQLYNEGTITEIEWKGTKPQRYMRWVVGLTLLIAGGYVSTFMGDDGARNDIARYLWRTMPF
jgi:hypothetical protein